MDLKSLRDETRVGIQAVRAAVELINARAGADQLRSKGDRDVVTAADVAVEDMLRERLSSRFPAIAIVGEERGGSANDGAAHWLIDPICGTRNFASEIPLCCTNLTLVEGGELRVAVIGDPTLNRVFVAERGRGAWRVSGDELCPISTEDSSGAICVEDHLSTGERRQVVSRFVAKLLATNRWYTRAYGSSLSAVYVAAGQLAAYTVFFTDSPVHLSAGTLLVTEAGGIATDIDGNPCRLDSDSLVLACDPSVHSFLMDLIAQAST